MRHILTILLTFSTYIYAEALRVDTAAITEVHNVLRAKYGSPPLHYSRELEKAARTWAKKLQGDGCGMVHSHSKVGDYGENLYWASPKKNADAKDANGDWIWHHTLQDIDEEDVVEAWYSEVQWYDYETNSCAAGQMCGHYTQLIWNTTTELGCAAMACDDRSQVWVCEYAPAGNVSIHYPSSGKTKRLRPY